jgi:DNA-binding Xre family transcriptional regulator
MIILPFNFKPLWKLLIDKNMKKTDLVEKVGLSKSTVAKMGKGEYVSMEVLDKICNYFGCQLSDIVEHINNQDY